MSNTDDMITRLFAYDGQTLLDERNSPIYEVGNFLGGGSAGTVYECENCKTHEHFALKILNPLGYKLTSFPLLKRCSILLKGEIVLDALHDCTLSSRNVWWLSNGSSRQYLSAFFSEKSNSMKELSLNQCIQIWGADPVEVGDDDNGEDDSTQEIIQGKFGPKFILPVIPTKYSDFVRKRRRILREIRNMRKISSHVNVIRLEGVMELIQESKCTLFLIMELANGGELFDRIKIDCGAREDTAIFFFNQLLLGVKHCHDQGVCHRDLKPEVSLENSIFSQYILIFIITLFVEFTASRRR